MPTIPVRNRVSRPCRQGSELPPRLRSIAPAFLLTDAHKRPSRQSKRMIEALQATGTPFQQTWDEKEPHSVKKSLDAVREFFTQHLR